MQKDKFDRIVSFLFGASWAIVLLGALIIINFFSFLGFPLSIFITISFIVVSMFMVLLLDSFSINRQRYEEAKKQTKLLEDILSKE